MRLPERPVKGGQIRQMTKGRVGVVKPNAQTGGSHRGRAPGSRADEVAGSSAASSTELLGGQTDGSTVR